MSNYQVIVGNVGTVYDGSNKAHALSEYDAYVLLSVDGYGRVADEGVCLMEDGEPIAEHWVNTELDDPPVYKTALQSDF
jgi:hypothetical protein